MNELKFQAEVHEELLKSAKLIYDAVSITLGARGQNVIIKLGNGRSMVTKDGVTVAKHVHSNSRLGEVGIELMLEPSERTNEAAGDGTTGAMVLAYNMLVEGIKEIRQGAVPISIKRGMDKANESVQSKLKRMAVKDFNVKDVALISANGDQEVANTIVQAFDMVGGKEGIINVFGSETSKTYIEHKEGMQIEHGLLTPHFVNNMSRGTAEYTNPRLLLVNGKILDVKHLMFHLAAAQEDDVPLIVIASEFGMEVVNMAATAKIKHGAKLLLIEAPLFGEERTTILTDLAHMTGSTLMSERTGDGSSLGAVGTDDKAKINAARKCQGTAKEVYADAKETTIYYDVDEDYIGEIKKLLKTKDKFARKRLAMLSGGIAAIFVGGNSEIEVEERAHRVEDAVNSVRGALEEGIVAGGGTALNEAREVISDLKLTDKNEKIGAMIVYFALYKPMEKILRNAGITKWSDPVYPYGIDVSKVTDVSNLEEVNMLDVGIIDSLKVIREELKNAVSVTSTILTTGALVIYAPGNE